LAYAYLMLLRMEVTAFHPARLRDESCAIRRWPYRCGPEAAHLTVSSLWPYSSVSRNRPAVALSGRPLAVLPPYGVRTFLAAWAARLPEPPCAAILPGTGTMQ